MNSLFKSIKTPLFHPGAKPNEKCGTPGPGSYRLPSDFGYIDIVKQTEPKQSTTKSSAATDRVQVPKIQLSDLRRLNKETQGPQDKRARTPHDTSSPNVRRSVSERGSLRPDVNKDISIYQHPKPEHRKGTKLSKYNQVLSNYKKLKAKELQRENEKAMHIKLKLDGQDQRRPATAIRHSRIPLKKEARIWQE